MECPDHYTIYARKYLTYSYKSLEKCKFHNYHKYKLSHCVFLMNGINRDENNIYVNSLRRVVSHSPLGKNCRKQK